MSVRREGLSRTAQMQVSKMSSRGVNGTDTEARNFIINANFDRQPVELSEHQCGMYTWRLCTRRLYSCVLFEGK